MDTFPLKSSPQAIVFDCDGTLMDTQRHCFRALEVMLEAHGHPADPDFVLSLNGRHYTEIGRELAQKVGIPDAHERLTQEFLDEFVRRTEAEPLPMTGAKQLLEILGRTVPMAVASNSPRNIVEQGLKAAGLLDFFEFITVPEGDTRPKPAPDVYLSAARRCGADPRHAIAVEDSRSGLLAARRAGLHVLGVGASPKLDEKELSDVWVGTLDAPELLAWASRVGSAAP